VALAAKARRLVLSHVSARYSISAEELIKEAREVFPETTVAIRGTIHSCCSAFRLPRSAFRSATRRDCVARTRVSSLNAAAKTRREEVAT